jgi:hypothetical protein
VLVAIASSRGSSGGEAPSSVTGCGLTWEKVDERVGFIGGSTPRTLTLWRSMGASPSTGALTINFTNAMTACSWVISHHDGVDTSGTNGSGAIVQSVDNGATSATPSVTLAAFGSANNATYGCLGLGASGINIAAGTGFTEIGEANSTAPVNDCQAEFRADNDTSVDWGNLGSSVAWGAIAIEIKAAATSTTHDAALSGASTSGGSLAATITKHAALTGASSSGGTLAAAVGMAASMSGTATSSGSLAVSLTAAVSLAGAASSTGTLAATITSPPITLAATATSGGSLAATIIEPPPVLRVVYGPPRLIDLPVVDVDPPVAPFRVVYGPPVIYTPVPA